MRIYTAQYYTFESVTKLLKAFSNKSGKFNLNVVFECGFALI